MAFLRENEEASIHCLEEGRCKVLKVQLRLQMRKVGMENALLQGLARTLGE